MGELAVVCADPRISKRDLLLFDRFYVPDLEVQLSRLSGAELADATFLVEKGVVLPAPSTLGALATAHGLGQESGPIWIQPSRHLEAIQANQQVLQITDDLALSIEIKNYHVLTFGVDLDVMGARLPTSAGRLIANSLTRQLGEDSYCAFMLAASTTSIVGALPHTLSFDIPISISLGKTEASGPSHVDSVHSEVGRDSRWSASGIDVHVNWHLDHEGSNEDWPVFEVVLASMPAPGEETPLEQILDFKADSLERRRLERLGRWLQGLLEQGAPSTRQLRRDIEDMLEAYTAEMTAHRMEIRHERLTFLVAFPIEVVRGLFDPRRLLEDVLSLRRAQTRLSQAEMKAPGREIAYIESASAVHDWRE